MASSASPVTWLPAALARAAVVRPFRATPVGGRHRAPEPPSTEPEYARTMFDPERDEQSALDWLGFVEAR